MKKKLDQMENHYIVCGYGEMGQIVVGELRKHKIPVVIIESDESALAHVREKKFLQLSGDATDENNLFQRGFTVPKVWYRWSKRIRKTYLSSSPRAT